MATRHTPRPVASDKTVIGSKTDWPIFTTSLVTLLAIAGPLMVWPEVGGRLVDQSYDLLTSQLGVVYI